MLVKKYKISGFNDPVHQFGPFNHWGLFIQEYSMLVVLDEKDKLISIMESEDPLVSDLYECDIPDDVISKFLEIYQLQKKRIELEKQLYNSVDFSNYYIPQETFEKYYTKAHNFYMNKSYEKALECYHRILNHSEYCKNIEIENTYHNIACCYAKLGRTEELFTYLDKIYQLSSTHWYNLYFDKDFSEYYSHPKFIQLIKNMYQRNPKHNELYYKFLNQYENTN